MAKKRQTNAWDNKIVKKVRYLSEAELAREGWDHRQKVTAFEFCDGSLIFASCDSEGNGPGALFGIAADGQTVWVSPKNSS